MSELQDLDLFCINDEGCDDAVVHQTVHGACCLNRHGFGDGFECVVSHSDDTDGGVGEQVDVGGIILVQDEFVEDWVSEGEGSGRRAWSAVCVSGEGKGGEEAVVEKKLVLAQAEKQASGEVEDKHGRSSPHLH